MLTHNYAEAMPDGCHNHGYYNIYEAMIIKL
jgi:putative heme iron utilization protein